MEQVPGDSRRADASHVDARLSPQDLVPDSRLQDSQLDAFGHGEIASRVADIALHGETPLNIALFGPWGSGKSSFFQLLTDALKAKDSTVRAVRYDAWKFGGASLKRHFVSHAASALDLDPDSPEGRPYHRGLYESIRTVDFSIARFFKSHWKALTGAALIALVVSTLLIVAVAAIWSAASDLAFGSRFAHLAPGVYTFLGTGLFAVGALINVLATANVEQTVPSEEERFADLFKELVRDATRGKEGEERPRLVFFIDELDRCSREDVVATLTSLRTFLDQENCVFVVAADRDVLEEALSAVEQPTPLREHEPYYSSASAFLDKIFQHQVTLPPLRTGRLTRFAKDLVNTRGGLWAELREAEERDRRLNDVLYALIPPHVRSPRRVKVLLNNYATNARVAESRGIHWRDRATEIATLTVLQTEFPHLASDLLLEPRLPTLLLHPPDDPTERQALLIKRHRVTKPDAASGANHAPDSETEDPDPLLVDGSRTNGSSTSRSAVRMRALRDRQREDLLRYLTSRKAAGVPDPGRDLLYLEDAGRAVGLDDPDLSQLLEDYAADDPARVREELLQRSPRTRLAAARMLGAMSERDFGPERRNEITALAQAVEGLRPSEFDGELGDLLSNIAAYRADEDLADAQLAGLLALAIGARDAGVRLREDLLSDARTLTDVAVLAGVAPLLPHVDPSELDEIGGALGRLHPKHPTTLLSLVDAAPVETVAAVLQAGGTDLIEAINGTEQTEPAGSGNEEGELTRAGRLAVELLECLRPRIKDLGEVAVDFLTAAVADPNTELYAHARDRAAALIEEIPSAREGNQVLLAALSSAPIDDWACWGGLLRSSNDPADHQRTALTHIIEWFAREPAKAIDAALDVVPRVLEAGGIVEPPASVPTSIAAGLGLLNFWQTDDALMAWRKALNLSEAISSALPELGHELDMVVAADIERASTVRWDAEVPARVASAGLSAGGPGLAASVTVLQGKGAASGPPVPDLPTAITMARMKVTGATATAGLDAPPVPLADVLTVARLSSTSAYEAVAAWFDASPPANEVMQVLDITKAGGSAIGSLTRWTKSQTPEVAKTAFLHVLDSDGDPLWLRPLSANAESRTTILDEITARLRHATTHNKRMRLVEAVKSMKPVGYQEVKRTAEMTLELLTRDSTKVVVEEAAVLAPLLTGSYRLKGRLNEALSAASRDGRIDKSPRRQFEAAGFSLPRPKGMVERFVGAVRGH